MCTQNITAFFPFFAFYRKFFRRFLEGWRSHIPRHPLCGALLRPRRTRGPAFIVRWHCFFFLHCIS